MKTLSKWKYLLAVLALNGAWAKTTDANRKKNKTIPARNCFQIRQQPMQLNFFEYKIKQKLPARSVAWTQVHATPNEQLRQNLPWRHCASRKYCAAPAADTVIT